MSKRLQVLIDEGEYRRIRKLAKEHRVTVAEWVRHALRQAAAQQPNGSMEKKLAAVRAAGALNLAPSPDIDQMNAEIEQGYLEPSRED
jgi:hypothetical protein